MSTLHDSSPSWVSNNAMHHWEVQIWVYDNIWETPLETGRRPTAYAKPGKGKLRPQLRETFQSAPSLTFQRLKREEETNTFTIKIASANAFGCASCLDYLKELISVSRSILIHEYIAYKWLLGFYITCFLKNKIYLVICAMYMAVSNTWHWVTNHT